jgi:hypothetical protein
MADQSIAEVQGYQPDLKQHHAAREPRLLDQRIEIGAGWVTAIALLAQPIFIAARVIGERSCEASIAAVAGLS